MATESINIWFNDPTILFKKDQINEIWPKGNMTRNQKINAITRLVIILTILGYLITQSLNFFMTGAITLGVIVFLYYAKTLTGNEKNEKAINFLYNCINYMSDDRIGNCTNQL